VVAIAVQLSILNNYQRIGWGTFHEVHPESAKKFAASVAAVMERYSLHVIDIDDEYSGDDMGRARVETDPKT
jgi:GH18 family chitinase